MEYAQQQQPQDLGLVRANVIVRKRTPRADFAFPVVFV